MNSLQLALAAQTFIEKAKEYKLELDYQLDSLAKVEDYLTKTMSNPAKPISKSLFADDMETMTMNFGAYIGEIVRRNTRHAKWNYQEGNSPWEIGLIQPNGNVGFPINKAFKRIHNGDEDNVHHFARVFLQRIFDEHVELTEDFYNDDDRRLAQYGDSPVTFYSNKITENGGVINHVNQHDGTWLFSYGREDEDDFDLLLLDEVKELHPEISELLTKSRQSRIEKEPDGNYRKQEGYEGMFFDSNTQAAFQGDMKPNYLRWAKMNLAKVLRITFYLIASFWLMINFHWTLGILFVGTLLYNLWYWYTVKGKFGGGNVSFGKVLSINPDLIAVGTDLSKGIGSYPVLKIMKTKLPKEDKKVGKYVPTIALYYDNPHDYPFWSVIDPSPVSHGITNRDHLAYLLSKFSQEDINELNSFIDQIKGKKEGTYKVNIKDSNWNDYSHVDINKGTSMEGPIDK